VLLCVVIGNFAENLSILTGIPFGHYHFTDVMGPKILNVPILLGLAYIGMGYLSWIVGRLILGNFRAPLAGSRVVTVPLVAAFAMTAWDLSMEPVWANFVHAWVWHDGGFYFGVPLSNFLGWHLTVYLIYQSFAVYLRGRATTKAFRYWRVAVVFYGVSAVGNLFIARPPGLSTITDASGTQWRVAAILEASVIVSICVMGAFTVIAWTRLRNRASSP